LLFTPLVSFDLIAPLLATYGYPVLFIAIALECAALPIPGELLLLALGGLAAQGHFDPSLGAVIAALAAVVGDSLSYGAGRRWGPALIGRIRVSKRWTPGALTIVFGRFVVGARVAVAPLAGAQRVNFARFVLFDALGAILWATLFVITGYVGGANIAVLQRHWAIVTGAVAGVIVAVAVTAYLVRVASYRSARRPYAAPVLLELASLEAVAQAPALARAATKRRRSSMAIS
jgi:membrane protein DedA with SNARE-associated domain